MQTALLYKGHSRWMWLILTQASSCACWEKIEEKQPFWSIIYFFTTNIRFCVDIKNPKLLICLNFYSSPSCQSFRGNRLHFQSILFTVLLIPLNLFINILYTKSILTQCIPISTRMPRMYPTAATLAPILLTLFNISVHQEIFSKDEFQTKYVAYCTVSFWHLCHDNKMSWRNAYWSPEYAL